MAIGRARAIEGQVVAGVIGAMVTAIVGYIIGVPALIASAATKAVAQVVVDRLEFEIQPETAATADDYEKIRCRDGYVLVMPLCQWMPAANQHTEGFFANVKLTNRDGNRVGTCTWTARMGNNTGSVGAQALCLCIK